MKSADEIKKFFKSTAIDTNPKMDEAVLNKVFIAHEKITNTKSAKIEPNIRRIIMKSPIIKITAAAVIVIAVLVCINQFGGSIDGTSVAWGEVAKKVEVSRGIIYRSRGTHSDEPDGADYSMTYNSPTRSRTDEYKGGHITLSIYYDFNAMTVVYLPHNDERKHYVQMTIGDQAVHEYQSEIDPKGYIQKFLSCEYRKLGPKMIEGVLCEGIETTDPTFGDANFPVHSLKAQLWVSVKTGYPVLCETKVTGGDDDKLRIEKVLDQFQWDVELDASEFEVNIPPDYTLLD
jgi:hypothetical protein